MFKFSVLVRGTGWPEMYEAMRNFIDEEGIKGEYNQDDPDFFVTTRLQRDRILAFERGWLAHNTYTINKIRARCTNQGDHNDR